MGNLHSRKTLFPAKYGPLCSCYAEESNGPSPETVPFYHTEHPVSFKISTQNAGSATCAVSCDSGLHCYLRSPVLLCSNCLHLNLTHEQRLGLEVITQELILLSFICIFKTSSLHVSAYYVNSLDNFASNFSLLTQFTFKNACRAQRNLSYQDSSIPLKFTGNRPEYTVSTHFPAVTHIHEAQHEK